MARIISYIISYIRISYKNFLYFGTYNFLYNFLYENFLYKLARHTCRKAIIAGAVFRSSRCACIHIGNYYLPSQYMKEIIVCLEQSMYVRVCVRACVYIHVSVCVCVCVCVYSIYTCIYSSHLSCARGASLKCYVSSV